MNTKLSIIEPQIQEQNQKYDIAEMLIKAEKKRESYLSIIVNSFVNNQLDVCGEYILKFKNEPDCCLYKEQIQESVSNYIYKNMILVCETELLAYKLNRYINDVYDLDTRDKLYGYSV